MAKQVMRTMEFWVAMDNYFKKNRWESFGAQMEQLKEMLIKSGCKNPGPKEMMALHAAVQNHGGKGYLQLFTTQVVVPLPCKTAAASKQENS
jgi:hypothetical protein